MILTRSELAKMAELFDAQELPDTFPDELEFSFLEVLAPTMTLKDYLAMPEQERRKWWISSQIMEPIPLTGPDPETGEDLFVTGFYFEPVAPNIPFLFPVCRNRLPEALQRPAWQEEQYSAILR